MTILLLGADGQVGYALRSTLPHVGKVIASTRRGDGDDVRCDLADPDAVDALLDATAPSVVVNAAAYTAVDKAESDVTAAESLNTWLPSRIGEWAARSGALVVHYSTDYVFDGTSQRDYVESDPPCPTSIYGSTKLAGDTALNESGARRLILRTAWVYGTHGHNFMRTMLRLAADRPRLSVVDDQWGTPTSAPWIAAVTASILEQALGDASKDGIYHLTASGSTTWCGFAEAIVNGAAQRGLLYRDTPVQPIATSDYPTPASRPARSILDGTALERAFGLTRPAWQDLLGEVLDTMAPKNSSPGHPTC